MQESGVNEGGICLKGAYFRELKVHICTQAFTTA